VKPTGDGTLDDLLDSGRQNTAYAAIVRRDAGTGKTIYFAFNFPQTIWVIHQGRPVTKDFDGDAYYRSSDNIALGRNIDLELPYADYWLQVLERILTQIPQPFIHQIPPHSDGTVPDMLFHYGGDDECTPGIQVKASNYMKEKGLQYHINLMPDKNGKFAINREEYELIKKNGHAPSLHFDFVKPHYHFTEADLKEQTEQYREAFGETPIATVNHWLMTTGWAEMARWGSSHGMKGDNSRVHSFSPPSNPINTLGFGFGTAYPHFVYDDYNYKNSRIPYVYIPICLYEPRVYKDTREADCQQIHHAIDRAAHFGWTLNVFLHPIYIADDAYNQDCLPAIEELIRYIKEKGYSPLHLSTNGLCLWWFDRSQASVELKEWSTSPDNGKVSISFTASTERAEGVLIKIPLHGSSSFIVSFLLDGQRGKHTIKQQNGQRWAIFMIPSGLHKAEIEVSQ